MMDALHNNAMSHLLIQSDTISKLILILLFCMSVITWAVFLGKLIAFRAKRRQLHKMLMRLRVGHSPQDILMLASETRGTMPSYFLSRTMDAYELLMKRRNMVINSQVHDWETMKRTIEQILDTVVEHEESYLPIISTCAAVAPLLGLLGTVWGLVHSFMRISELRTADIATVAPGIAEALITTFAGLIVAIPALMMYNYLIVRVRKIEQQAVLLADRIEFIMQPLLMH
jgi:biopolymer transport protein TolQ